MNENWCVECGSYDCIRWFDSKVIGYDVKIKKDCEGWLVYHKPLDLAIYGETRRLARERFRSFMSGIDYEEAKEYINNPSNWGWMDNIMEYSCYA